MQTIKCALLLLAFAVCCHTDALCQNQEGDERMVTVNKYLAAYNNQDYEALRDCFGGIMKALFTGKRLKKMYEPQYELQGKAKIASVNISDEGYINTLLRYERDTTEEFSTGFAISGKNKIIGLSFKSPYFEYSLKQQMAALSNEEVSRMTDSLLHIKYENSVFNGCALVIRNGQTIYKDCFGYSNYESKLPLNEASVFELASCTKQFTAVSILQLQQQGKLNVQDDVRKYIPELPYKGITIENFLTHTSGIPEYFDLLDEHWDKTKFVTNEDMVKLFAQYHPKPDFAPGKQFSYCNTGYAMLSVIIERVSGISYSDFLSTNIFQPLGMKNTRVYNTRRVKNETLDNYAYGYVYSDSLKAYMIPDKLPDYNFVIYLDAITGDGTVNSNLVDLAIWEAALRTDKLLPQPVLAQAFMNHVLSKKENTDYGYGWELQTSDSTNHKVAYHSGGWSGYTTFIVHFLDMDNSIIILSNNEYMNLDRTAYKIGSWLMRE